AATLRNSQSETFDADWTARRAGDLYGMSRWAGGYFDINDAGHVDVLPTRDPARRIDLHDLVSQLAKRDLNPPLLLRFSDILRTRLDEIATAFTSAREEFHYNGRYHCVYPIKVNQQQHVVEEIIAIHRDHGFGFEAGSKPELLAIMALIDDDITPIICNGFKDRQFVDGVILATKLGRNIMPVVENERELRFIVEQAKTHDVRPRIGIRLKLATRGAGRWESSGGDKSKFGLHLGQLFAAVEYLKQYDMLDCLRLLHFHLGSQLTDIARIKAAVTELARVYVELRKLGAGLDMLDVGGGLGIDYGGASDDTNGNINYSLAEYANNIVFHIAEVCNESGTPHPTILSESGRALVSYQSVLVFNVLGSSGIHHAEPPPSYDTETLSRFVRPVQLLYETYDELTEQNVVEFFHDAQRLRDEIAALFNLGHCSLEDRALCEQLYFGICVKAYAMIEQLDAVPQDLRILEPMLASLYFINGSIFQSLPDSWAIGQLFPVMPIHRLNERPTRFARLADITCDSDGRLDRFVSETGTCDTLPVHPLNDEPYHVGVFLVGAYQEILGDLHNLFGDTHAVHVRLGDGEPMIEEVVEGDSVSKVLQYVQYDPEALRRRFRLTMEQAIRDKRLTLEEAAELRRFYESGLAGYTYLA
ncbi:MAG: biosynthetic arginine decarboxylase, partial [Rhodospirillales bacterium]|nr:biosynthetic arginine decarboxylase [Rhodospirillales bacterium]